MQRKKSNASIRSLYYLFINCRFIYPICIIKVFLINFQCVRTILISIGNTVNIFFFPISSNTTYSYSIFYLISTSWQCFQNNSGFFFQQTDCPSGMTFRNRTTGQFNQSCFSTPINLAPYIVWIYISFKFSNGTNPTASFIVLENGWNCQNILLKYQ